MEPLSVSPAMDGASAMQDGLLEDGFNHGTSALPEVLPKVPGPLALPDQWDNEAQSKSPIPLHATDICL